jgi:hypothetical protein
VALEVDCLRFYVALILNLHLELFSNKNLTRHTRIAAGKTSTAPSTPYSDPSSRHHEGGGRHRRGHGGTHPAPETPLARSLPVRPIPSCDSRPYHPRSRRAVSAAEGGRVGLPLWGHHWGAPGAPHQVLILPFHSLR